jgi:hypothetical protein
MRPREPSNAFERSLKDKYGQTRRVASLARSGESGLDKLWARCLTARLRCVALPCCGPFWASQAEIQPTERDVCGVVLHPYTTPYSEQAVAWGRGLDLRNHAVFDSSKPATNRCYGGMILLHVLELSRDT